MRRDQTGDIRPRDRSKDTVARHAARERPKRTLQLERLDDLHHLLLGIARTQPLPTHDGLAFEQSHVTRQEYPLLACRDRGQLRIVEPIAVAGVEAEQTQVPRESPEMDVGHEAWLSQRLWSESMEWRDIETLELGIHRNPLAATQSAIETY